MLLKTTWKIHNKMSFNRTTFKILVQKQKYLVVGNPLRNRRWVFLVSQTNLTWINSTFSINMISMYFPNNINITQIIIHIFQVSIKSPHFTINKKTRQWQNIVIRNGKRFSWQVTCLWLFNIDCTLIKNTNKFWTIHISNRSLYKLSTCLLPSTNYSSKSFTIM